MVMQEKVGKPSQTNSIKSHPRHNFFGSMVNLNYPSELQLDKANVPDTEASFVDLHLSISDGYVEIKIYDKTR